MDYLITVKDLHACKTLEINMKVDSLLRGLECYVQQINQRTPELGLRPQKVYCPMENESRLQFKLSCDIELWLVDVVYKSSQYCMYLRQDVLLIEMRGGGR